MTPLAATGFQQMMQVTISFLCPHNGKTGLGVSPANRGIIEEESTELSALTQVFFIPDNYTSSRRLSNTNFKGTMLEPAKNIYNSIIHYSQVRRKSPITQMTNKTLQNGDIYVYLYL